MSHLKGKNAIITGASRGIGKAIALRLAENGINLVLAARNQAPLDQTVKEIKEKFKVKVIGVSTDVAKLDDLKLIEVEWKVTGILNLLHKISSEIQRTYQDRFSIHYSLCTSLCIHLLDVLDEFLPIFSISKCCPKWSHYEKCQETPYQ